MKKDNIVIGIIGNNSYKTTLKEQIFKQNFSINIIDDRLTEEKEIKALLEIVEKFEKEESKSLKLKKYRNS